ncbi:protease [Epithele typhae]|uniref:protease n=1 Tax=Epithele typhae TaxID=378194 RepID=UPI0020073244|nr:protease [Epithele typhae]KAH9923776.1 protease [Epithele typhae]
MLAVSSVLLSLALSAFAAPAPDAHVRRISTRNIKSLKTSDGSFDHQRAIRQVAYDHNKYRSNLISLHDNVGAEAFKDGARILPPVEPFVSPSEQQGTETLNNEQNELWAGIVGVGTPQQNFNVDFDTGSADLWIPSANCTTTDCAQKAQYHPERSSTSQRHDNEFGRIRYQDGSTASGSIFTDTVTVAGISVKNQGFAAVDSISDELAHRPIDGVIGLGYPALAKMGQTPFINNARAQGSIKHAEFGLRITDTTSELEIGFQSGDKCTDDPEVHPVTGESGYWQISNGMLGRGLHVYAHDFSAVIDSGTTLIYGPPADVAKFYKSVEGAELWDESNGFYSFPCDEAPSDAHFQFDQGWRTISAENFNFGQIDETTCIGAIVGRDMGLGKKTWVLGDSFLKNVYAAFSFETNEVSFCRPRD